MLASASKEIERAPTSISVPLSERIMRDIGYFSCSTWLNLFGSLTIREDDRAS